MPLKASLHFLWVKVNNEGMETMKWSLLDGTWSKTQGLDFMDDLVRTQIKFLERQIGMDNSEEEIKMREKAIKQLQHEYAEVRKKLTSSSAPLSIEIMANFSE
jgi:hypothetical protein